MSKITFIDLKFLKLVIILKQINLRIFIRYLGLLLHSSIWQLLQSPPYYNLSASKSKTHFNPKTLDRIHHFSQNPNPKTQKHIHIERGLRFRGREVSFRFRVLQTYWFRWPRSYGIGKLKTKVTRGYAVDPMDDKHADGWKGACPRARNNKLIWKHFLKTFFKRQFLKTLVNYFEELNLVCENIKNGFFNVFSKNQSFQYVVHLTK